MEEAGTMDAAHPSLITLILSHNLSLGDEGKVVTVDQSPHPINSKMKQIFGIFSMG